LAGLRLAVRGDTYASIAQPVLDRLNAAQDCETVSMIHLMGVIQDAEAVKAMRT